MIDTKELRRLAQAATPHVGHACKYQDAHWLREGHVDFENADLFIASERPQEDAAFYAAANPAAISELIDRLEAAEKERDELLAGFDEWLDKTKWVQQGVNEGMISAKYLGLHRADVMTSLLGEAEKERDDVAQQLVQSEQGKRKISEECDELRNEIACVKEVEFPRKAQAVADAWKGKCERLEAERDALRAKIEAMEQQEPVAWMLNCPTLGGDTGWILSWTQSGAGLCNRLSGEENEKKLYALPGAQPQLNEIKIALQRALELSQRETWTGARKHPSWEDQREEQQCWNKVWSLLGAQGEEK